MSAPSLSRRPHYFYSYYPTTRAAIGRHYRHKRLFGHKIVKIIDARAVVARSLAAGGSPEL
jgi:hypothetical protein